MAKQIINLGTAPTGAGGDTFRSALVKAQANMDELYNAGVAIAALTGQANIDMNVFTTAGVYLFNNPTANSPGFDYGTIEVQPRASSEIIQIARGIISDIEVTRRYLGGSWTPWRRNYHTGSILGTVSQASGVPTGAIIETGTNSNGTYVKYADGTMLCRGKIIMPAQALNSSSSVLATLPAAFIDQAFDVTHSGIAVNGSGAQADIGNINANGIYMTKSVSTITFLSYSYRLAVNNPVQFSYIAMGRWF